jgi:hypothetical protein
MNSAAQGDQGTSEFEFRMGSRTGRGELDRTRRGESRAVELSREETLPLAKPAVTGPTNLRSLAQVSAVTGPVGCGRWPYNKTLIETLAMI